MIWRIIYPLLDEWKLLRIFDVPVGQAIAFPKTCSKMLEEEWGNLMTEMGGVEQDVYDMLGVTEVQDMR